jgi:hypothetical protein
MSGLVALLIPAIVVIVIAIVVLAINARFSPDPLITKIVNIVVYALVLIWLLTKLLPMIH